MIFLYLSESRIYTALAVKYAKVNFAYFARLLLYLQECIYSCILMPLYKNITFIYKGVYLLCRCFFEYCDQSNNRK